MDASYQHCEQLVRAADKDRYLATLFAPAEKRGPLFALYAFDLEIAAVHDRVREPMAGEIRLQWWRDVLNGERGGEAASHPVAAALRDTIGRFDLPGELLLDMIEAHAFDLYDDPMPTLQALLAYAQKSCTTPIALAARVLAGQDAPALAAASSSGFAFGLSETLRRLAQAASRRRLYVPLDVLERHGVRIDDVFVGKATPELRVALADLRDRARQYLASFEALLPRVPAAAMPAFLPVSLVASTLAEMERSGYDPFRTAVDVPQWRRQWALWRAARRYSRLMRGQAVRG